VHRFQPPPPPGNFEAAVAAFRAAVETLFTAGKLGVKATAKPAKKPSKKKPKPAKEPEVFPAKWRDFKAELSRAQHLKCGFCEGYAVGQGHGDVEHYAPKSEVRALGDDQKTWGEERPYLASVVGRQTALISSTGYWWLAYDWDNYVLACSICNSAWKGTLFPIGEQRAAAPTPADQETRYLLHPFRGEAPQNHLEFGPLGEVKPKTTAAGPSVYGRETIRTLGLDRPSLREHRRTKASKIHKKIDALQDASVERRRELLTDIRDEGAEDQPHCGMVRAILEQRTQMTWTQLEDELSK
jgi:hypothetical protein